MVDRNRLTRRSALGLLAAGSLALATKSGGKLVARPDRDVVVQVASDDNAYVGLDGFKQGQTYKEPHRVTVTNQTGKPFSGEVHSPGGSSSDLTFQQPGSSTNENPLSLDGGGDIADGGTASFDVVTDPSVSGTVTNDVTIAVEGTGTLSVDVTRAITVETQASAKLSYALGKDLHVYDVIVDGEFDPPDSGKVNAVGSIAADVRGNGSADLPYIDNQGLRVTAVNGSDEAVPRNANSKIRSKKTRITTGSWPTNGLSNPMILYATKNGTIEGADGSGAVEEIADPGDGVGAISGVADVDDDGQDELVFLDGSQNLQYLEQNGSIVDIGKGVGSNNNVGLGPPVDFSDDGTARIPIVDGSNNLALVAADGTKTNLAGGGPAKKSPVAPADADGDGTPEFAFLDDSTGVIRYLDDVTGSNTLRTFEDANGNTISPDAKVGVNAGTSL